MSQEAGLEDGEFATNNNSGHIVVDSSENNNVAGASLYNKEDDEEGQDEDDDLMDDDADSDGDDGGEETDDDIDDYQLHRVPVPISELPETTILLERNGCRVYVVGTAHFSRESQLDVSKVIRAVKPHIVMVELCQSRVNILKMDEEQILEEAKNINLSTIQEVIKKNGVMQGVLNILLLNMSAYITKELGMAPGGEFRVAFNEARHLRGGCNFILGDRPIQITLRRALASLSLWQKLKLAYAILFSKEPITKEDVEKCKQKDLLEQMIEEMTGEFPALGRVFVSERDVFLAHSLQELAKPIPCPDAPEGENIFIMIQKEFAKLSIPWRNVTSFCCDNASVMMGIHKGVAKFVRDHNPAVFIHGCACHLLHLAAKAGSKELHKDIEGALIDIYAFLDKSTKRKKEFLRFQMECGVKLNKILKHGATRWLSLEACVARLLDQWEPLKLFFQAEYTSLSESQQKSSKFERLRRVTKFLNDPTSRLYCLFLRDAMPIFNTCNLALQRDSPQIHEIQQRFHNLFTDILIRFVKTSAITKCDNLFGLEHSSCKNQVPREELKIGSDARVFLDTLKSTGQISSSEEDGFVKGHIPSVVVGVVGIGHVQGIKDNWDKQLEIQDICRIPPTSKMMVVARWSFRLSLLGLMSYGCYRLTQCLGTSIIK